MFWAVFSKISDQFLKISKDFKSLSLSEGHTDISEHFLKICDQDNWRLPKNSAEDSKVFCSYNNTFNCSLKGQNVINMISHMCDIVFINLLPLNTPLTFITIHYSNHHLFHFHQQEVSQGQLTGTRHKL